MGTGGWAAAASRATSWAWNAAMVVAAAWVQPTGSASSPSDCIRPLYTWYVRSWKVSRSTGASAAFAAWSRSYAFMSRSFGESSAASKRSEGVCVSD